MSKRLYCWMVGGPVEFVNGRCPECFDTKHRVIPDDWCGHWAKGENTELGTYCELEPGHIGKHFTTLRAIDDEGDTR